ncbi:glycosyltransferase family 4 protein [Psychrobacter glacincola]
MFVFNNINAICYKYQAKKAYRKQDWQACIRQFSNALRDESKLTKLQADIFNNAKEKYKGQSIDKVKKIAVCGWDLSHNAAGRVLTLAELYQHCGEDISIVGCIVSTNHKRPRALWEPMKLSDIPCEYITVKDTSDLIKKAFDFVSSHPFDIIHLSKPRLPNLIIGRLYQLIWDANIIMDIDDEELGFCKPSERHSLIDSMKTIRSNYWLARSVSLFNTFDAITVSNTSLQLKYSGTVIPHVRDAKKFTPSKKLRSTMREQHGIPPSQKVVLFFGTPKPHKGLVETAYAISDMPEGKPLFLIIGDFVDQGFKEKLAAIKGVNFKFLPNQPYHLISSFVAIGDICVIFQDPDSLIGEHQLPAKLIDALAMGLTVISTQTPALKPLIEAGAVMATDKYKLTSVLVHALSEPNQSVFNRNYFVHNLSTQVFVPVITGLLKNLRSQNHPIYSNKCYDIVTLTEYHSSL